MFRKFEMSGWICGRAEKRAGLALVDGLLLMGVWTDRWIDRQTDEWTDEWMDRWMNRQTDLWLAS